MADNKPKSLDGPVDLDDIVLNDNIDLAKLEEERECMRLGEEATRRIEREKINRAFIEQIGPMELITPSDEIKEGDKVFYCYVEESYERACERKIATRVIYIGKRTCLSRTGKEYLLEIMNNPLRARRYKLAGEPLTIWLPDKPFIIHNFYPPVLKRIQKNKP